MIEWIKSIWKDNVWGKVIAEGFIVLIGLIGVWIMAFAKEISFTDYLTQTVTTQIWVVLLVAVIVVPRLIYDIVSIFRNRKPKQLSIKAEKIENEKKWKDEYIKYKAHCSYKDFFDTIRTLSLPHRANSVDLTMLEYYKARDLFILRHGSYQLTPKGQYFQKLYSIEQIDGPIK